MFDDIKKLLSDFKAGNYSDCVIDAGNALVKIGTFAKDMLGGAKMACDDGQLGIAIGECEMCVAECKEKGAALPADIDPKKIDPATLALILSSIIELLKFIREWRKKRQEG